MRHLFSLLFGLLLLTSCAPQYNIDGASSLACLDGQKLYLRLTSPNGRTTRTIDLDSCEVVHGRFNFGGSIDSIALAAVYMGAERLMPIVLERGELLIQVDNYEQSVTGSPLNDRLNVFRLEMGRLEASLWELDNTQRRLLYAGHSIEDVRHQLDGKRKHLQECIEDLEVAFILDNYNNPLGPGYFAQLAQEMGSPTLTRQIQRIVDAAPDRFFTYPAVSEILLQVGYKHPAMLARKKAKRKLLDTPRFVNN